MGPCSGSDGSLAATLRIMNAPALATRVPPPRLDNAFLLWQCFVEGTLGRLI
jgi:hypothetical protein